MDIKNHDVMLYLLYLATMITPAGGQVPQLGGIDKLLYLAKMITPAGGKYHSLGHR